MSILVPFWSANIHKRPVWRLLGGVLARPGELVSSSAYRTPVHSVLSAEQKLLHSVQVQTKCSELSVHSVLSARQNLCMSGKCRVHCALCVAWRAAAVQPRLCRMWHTCLACVRFRFCTCATSASGYVDSLPKVTINLISR